MKKLKSGLFVLVLTAGVLNCVEAQRGSNRGLDRPARSFNGSPQNNDRGNFNRGFSNPGNESRNIRPNNMTPVSRAAMFRHDDGRANAINTSRIIGPVPQRSEVALSYDRNRDYERGYNPGVSQNAFRPNRIARERSVSPNVYSGRNNYSYGGNYYNRGYYNTGGYYPHFFGYGPRYRILPRSFISINFGGYPYYYNEGLFYGLYGGYYQPLFPPPGLSISVLPFGYSRIFVGDNPFYYYNGIYYRQYPDRDNYEVVDAPLGATVSSLPKGAKSVVLNGEKLYELNGTYYKEDRNSKGQTVYTVVGKNGEVNNSDNASDNSVNNLPPASLNNGEVINQLPEGSKIVTINGEKLYVTPDNIYLKEESDGNRVQYKVVGK